MLDRRPGEKTLSPDEDTKRREREERILTAAAELTERWGYRKTTIDDIAKLAGVAKGTIYLHWKTREDLFIALLMREQNRAASQLEHYLASDPEGATLQGIIKYSTLVALKSPLLKAILLRDHETLGDLIHTEFGRELYELKFARTRVYLEELRNKGLIRTDLELNEQIYILSAITTGFLMVDQFLPDESKISDEETVEKLAETIQRTFEIRPPTPAERQEVTATYMKILELSIEQSEQILSSPKHD